MRLRLGFVPPDGGETDYSLLFDMPAVPQPGDYISISRAGEDGVANFIVRRTWWHLSHPTPNDHTEQTASDPIGKTVEVLIECEFARGVFSSKSHNASCEMHRKRKGTIKSFDSSMH